MTGTFEGVGSLQFTPDNKWCYAYSGLTSVSGSLTTMLDIQTNSEYIVVTIELNGNRAGIGQAQIQFKILLNGVTIMFNIWDQSTINQYSDDLTVTRLLIPPHTSALVQVAQSSGTNRNMEITLTGEVYGAIEQENLESITDNNKWASL